MGLLKKIFKPVSKVLDKIVPNEIKPFLPYAAAFAPMLAPGIMGTSVMQRALMGGGLNIFGQLSQEGNEGDINLLSAGLGALSGAMTAPGTEATSVKGDLIKKVPDFSMSAAGEGPALTTMRFPGMGAERVVSAGQPSASQFFTNLSKGAEGSGVMASGQKFLGDTLAKGSDIMSAGLKEGLFSKAGLKAATLPAATATGDLMFAQAKRDQDEADRLANEEAENEYASDASRAFAIRQSMESYGFTEQEILDAIAAAGYADGGAVGIMNAKRGLVDGPGGYSGDWITKKSKDWITKKDKKINLDDIVSSALDDDEDEEDDGIEWIKKKDSSGSNKWIQKKASGGRVGLKFGGIGDAVENIEDEEIKESAKFAMNDMDIPIMDLVEEFEITFKRKPNSLEELKQFYRDRYEYKGPGDVKMQEEIKEKVVMEAKDGGLMDLGGKEMDMRGGGFIPIGKKERADDVPARLSKNEFVMTADAVRAAGGGSVNEGAKRMYETMNKLEARA